MIGRYGVALGASATAPESQFLYKTTGTGYVANPVISSRGLYQSLEYKLFSDAVKTRVLKAQPGLSAGPGPADGPGPLETAVSQIVRKALVAANQFADFGKYYASLGPESIKGLAGYGDTATAFDFAAIVNASAYVNQGGPYSPSAAVQKMIRGPVSKENFETAQKVLRAVELASMTGGPAPFVPQPTYVPSSTLPKDDQQALQFMDSVTSNWKLIAVGGAVVALGALLFSRKK